MTVISNTPDVDPVVTGQGESFVLKTIRREHIQKGMLTFPVGEDPNSHVYLEPIPVVPANPPGRPVTTLSKTEKISLSDAVRQISSILLEIDPLNIGHYDDEYDPEACAILSMLKNTASEDEVAPVIIDVFKQYVDRDLSGDLTDPAWTGGLRRMWNILKTHVNA